MNVAVYGAGSLGTIMGAFLSESDADVDLIDVNEEHVNKLNEDGAHVVGETDYHHSVNALTPDQIDKEYDVILLLTKQVFNKDVIPKVKDILKYNGTVVSLQNGIPEELIQEVIPAANIVAGSVEFGATFEGPGVSRLTTEFETFKNNAIQIGELDGAITDRTKMVQRTLEPIGGISVSDNLLGTKWTKLIINSALSGMSAATNGTYGDVMDDKVGQKAALYAMNEVVEVGQSNGVKFEQLSIFDPKYYAVIKDETDQIETMRETLKSSRGIEASMLQDLRKGRVTEINYINGAVTKIGREKGVATPVNDLIVDIVSEAQNNKAVPDFHESMKRFESLFNESN
ncbi:ketopantoate reductase family protein [Staphylococcus simulans]|uniref:ketopantoate reductase family protein n=1 Tax=Staphylococcus simulans TaxID=1286 RepID=UPI003999FD94